MRDRKFLLRFLSVLVTGAFLVSAISPVVAVPGSDKGQTGRIDSRVSGAGSASAVHASPCGLDGVRLFSNTTAGLIPGNHTPGWFTSPGGEPTGAHNAAPGPKGNSMTAGRGEEESSRILDPLKRPSPNPGGDQIRSRWVTGEGIIRFINLEGDGFYGIITPSGDHYIPDNLPDFLAAEGVQVMFRGMTNGPAINVRMWGTPLHLISIDKTLPEISATGRVIFIDLEGGFFGIITPSGERYLPLNLPDQFKTDGTEVVFTAHKEPDTATIFMWGVPILLDSIDSSGKIPGSLTGSWYLSSYLDGTSLRPVIPGTVITADFSENGKVAGTAGCNRYFGSCDVTGSTLEVGTIGSTKMYCSSPTGSMQQENTYLNLLGTASAFSMKNGNLVLFDEKGNEILIFSKDAAAPPRETVPLLEYTRTGGFAGFDDHLVLYPDGSGLVNRKESARCITGEPEVLQELKVLLESANFDALEEEYPASHEGADYFTYSLTYEGKTVVMEDTAIPEVLEPVIAILNEIIGSSAPDDVIPPLPTR